MEKLMEQQQSPTLNDCLKLLRGDKDEQRLAGLFLVTKYCNNDDDVSIRKVYDAVGTRFLDRLLQTGMGRVNVAGGDNVNRDAYLQLSITVLAAFCRVPEIVSSKEMVSKVPLILQVMTPQLSISVLEECYEFLLLVSTASKEGVDALFQSGVMKVLAPQMESLPDGSRALELSIKLLLSILSKISPDTLLKKYPTELSIMVPSISRQFALLQNAVKFELLHLLSVILSSHSSAPPHNVFRPGSNDNWPTYIRAGIVDILQNLVGPEQKLQALEVAESLVNMLGEGWLISDLKAPDIKYSTPPNRCLLLVLETSRVEVAVLLNDLGYLKYEASSSKTTEISVKQQNLAVAFSLVEKIIKLISDTAEDEGKIISDATLVKAISGLNETIGVVLDYLKDAKDHGHRKADDLLASVRVVGSYLAQTPIAWEEKVTELLGYILSVEGEDESSPLFSVCFLLPTLCQMATNIEGANILASSGGYRAVVECLVKLVSPGPYNTEDNSCLFLACDTVMNMLLKREELGIQLDESVFIPLLKAFATLTEGSDDSYVKMLASSICCLIFETTSEEALLSHPGIDSVTLSNLSRLIAGSLVVYEQGMVDDAEPEAELYKIITAGYSRWAYRFPSIRAAMNTNISFTLWIL